MNVIDLIYLGFFSIMIFSGILWILVFASRRREIHKASDTSEDYSVTFLVPAYNEEKHIEETIQSLLNQNYPDDKIHIIAINDGSTDDTLEKMEKYSDRIEIIDKENSGKSSSLNKALERVDTDLVASMDADSYPNPEYLRKMVAQFDKEDVNGVTPGLKLRDSGNWVKKIQWTEYIFQIFLRKVFSIFDVQYVLPGPGSVYDADYLKKTEGWDENTFTEDMEIAFRMFSDGYRIENVSDAFVYTTPPETLFGLFRQRIRWYRGYIECLFKYKNMFANPFYGNLGCFLLPLNTLWIFLMVFILFHSAYNVLSSALNWVNTYMLLGYVPIEFNLFFQDAHLFHLFLLFFIFMGASIILLSLKTAEEEVRPVRRRWHYLLYMTIYPFLFAMFWVATFVEELRPGDDRKW